MGAWRQIVRFDTATWQPDGAPTRFPGRALALAYRPDGQEIAAAAGEPGRSGSILFVRADTGSVLRTWNNQFGDTTEAVTWHPSRDELLAGGDDNKARLYTAASQPSPLSRVLDEHNGRVTAAAFSPKLDFFVTGALDRVVKVWDEKQMRTVINFDQSEGGISGLAFLPGGLQFVGASLDGRLYWWQVNFDLRKAAWTGSRFRTQEAHPGGVIALNATPDGKRLITAGMDNAVTVWDGPAGRKLRTFTDSARPCYATAISPDGKLAAAAGLDGIVRVWDVQSNRLTASFSLSPLSMPARR